MIPSHMRLHHLISSHPIPSLIGSRVAQERLQGRATPASLCNAASDPAFRWTSEAIRSRLHQPCRDPVTAIAKGTPHPSFKIGWRSRILQCQDALAPRDRHMCSEVMSPGADEARPTLHVWRKPIHH